MRRTPDELKDVLRFIGDNWAGDDADACHEAITLIAALESRLADAEKVVEAAAELAEMVVVPDPNCSCHISPPCSDCVDNLGTREALANVNTALTAYRKETT